MLRKQEAVVREIRERARAAEAALGRVMSAAQSLKPGAGASIWASNDVSGQTFTFAEVILEAQRVVRSVKGFHWMRAGLASFSATTNVNTALQSVEDALKRIEEGIEAVRGESRSLGVQAGPVIVTVPGGEQVMNVGDLTTSLQNQIDALKSQLPSFLLYSRSEPDIDAEEIRSFATKLGELQSLREEVQAALDAVKAAQGAAETIQSDLSSAKAAFDTESEQLKAKLSEMIGEADSAKAHTAESKSDADALLKQIEAAKVTIEALAADGEDQHKVIVNFGASLEETKARLQAVEARADRAHQQQSEYIAEVEALIKRAEAMVSGATVAGLAKAFADERAALEEGMKGAIKSFFVGIGSIFLVTLLLAAYVFEIPFKIGSIQLSGPGATTALGDEITIAGVLSRTIILLAPFWLTLFSARRYRNLFDLRQQYSHKYNMAFSVDGFKQQAPKYEEDIAAWVFHVVAESPINSKSKRGMDENPLPTIEDIVKIPGERFSELLKAVGKG